MAADDAAVAVDRAAACTGGRGRGRRAAGSCSAGRSGRGSRARRCSRACSAPCWASRSWSQVRQAAGADLAGDAPAATWCASSTRRPTAATRWRSESADLRASGTSCCPGSDRRQAALDALRRSAETQGILTGRLPAEGPGVVVTLTEPDGPSSPSRCSTCSRSCATPARRPIELNDQRITASSAFTGGPGAVVLDGDDPDRAVRVDRDRRPRHHRARRCRSPAARMAQVRSNGGEGTVERRDKRRGHRDAGVPDPVVRDPGAAGGRLIPVCPAPVPTARAVVRVLRATGSVRIGCALTAEEHRWSTSRNGPGRWHERARIRRSAGPAGRTRHHDELRRGRAGRDRGRCARRADAGRGRGRARPAADVGAARDAARRRAPAPGSCSTPSARSRAARRRRTSSSTTSPSRASTPSSCGRAAVRRSATSGR